MLKEARLKFDELKHFALSVIEASEKALRVKLRYENVIRKLHKGEAIEK